MKKPKLLPFKEFKAIYSKVPRLTVEVMIMTAQGIVLTKRDIEPAKGKWHTPGGTILMGEKVEQTVKRVAKSETGIEIDVIKLLGVIEFNFKGYFSQPIALAYLAKPKNNNFKIKFDHQATEIGIFKKIPANTIKEHAAFIKKYLGLK